jgi:hypothetical protein
MLTVGQKLVSKLDHFHDGDEADDAIFIVCKEYSIVNIERQHSRQSHFLWIYNWDIIFGIIFIHQLN